MTNMSNDDERVAKNRGTKQLPFTNFLITDQKLASLDDLVELIRMENVKQIGKWGTQTDPPQAWMTWIMEELGEMAEAISHYDRGKGNAEAVVAEAIQVATLVLKVAEIYMKPWTMDKIDWWSTITMNQGTASRLG